MNSTARIWSSILLAGVATALASCTPAGPQARIDGVIEEWSSETAVVADGDSVYFRFKLPGEPAALQASARPVGIYLDVDGNRATGRTSTLIPLNKLGVDTEIVFSPRTAEGKPGRGVAVRSLGRDGKATPIPNRDAGVLFSPTYASVWYELSVDRALFDQTGGRGAVRATGMIVTFDEKGEIDGYADPFEVALPPRSAKPAASAELPMKPADSLRVVTFNVLKDGPTKTPDPYARLLYLLNPDVILFQEWDKGDAASVDAWLTQQLAGMEGDWTVCKTENTGVAVATRLPLAALPPDTLWMSDGSDSPRQVRIAAAAVTTDAGPVNFASLHLKCCGGAVGREETIRQGEARAINKMLAGMPGPTLVAGDFNLVGTRLPLDLLRAGLDGKDALAIAEPQVLGDTMKVTWRDWKTEFTPGRLDYAVYSASRIRVVNSFVLDVAALSDESLARMGLDRADGAASDHLPVVLDIVVK